MRDVESSDGVAMVAGIEVVAQPIPTRFGLDRPVWAARGRYVAGVVALAVAYYGAAKVSYALEFAGPVAAIVWLPAGVGIAFLSLGGLRFWPAVLIGDLLANDYAALPLGAALGQTLGNMLEVLVAALVIRRLLARGSPSGQPRRARSSARRDRQRDGHQRDHRPIVTFGRRRHQRRRPPGRRAHLVARRRRRGADRDSARAGLVSSTAAWLAAGPGG